MLRRIRDLAGVVTQTRWGYLVDCDGVHDKVMDDLRVSSPPPPDETVNLHRRLSSMKERVSTERLYAECSRWLVQYAEP
jgi:hypothetical protein